MIDHGDPQVLGETPAERAAFLRRTAQHVRASGEPNWLKTAMELEDLARHIEAEGRHSQEET